MYSEIDGFLYLVVSKAFQVLSGKWAYIYHQYFHPYEWFWGLDPQKRAAYDQHGSDPESRFSGMSSSSRGQPSFSGASFGGTGFEGELSPEDLFNMFFGGGMGGGATFGGGPSKL